MGEIKGANKNFGKNILISYYLKLSKMEKNQFEVQDTFGVQNIGYSLSNGGPFIIVPTEQAAYLQGEISITDSRDNSTEAILNKHLDRHAEVWQALA